MRSISINFRYCSSGRGKFPYSMGTHTHTFWELVYYYEGTGISCVNNVEHTYTPHTYVLIPPGVPHSEIAHTKGNLHIFGMDIFQNEPSFQNVIFEDDENFTVEENLKKILSELQKCEPFYRERISLAMEDVFLLTARKHATLSENAMDDKLQMIVRYIDSYHTTEINFHKLAETLNYSYDYLRHFFKEKLGISPKQYIIQKRIETAKDLLANSKTSIAQIANVCGFYSAAHLVKAFKNATGTTPSAYRTSRSKDVSPPCKILN